MKRWYGCTAPTANIDRRTPRLNIREPEEKSPPEQIMFLWHALPQDPVPVGPCQSGSSLGESFAAMASGGTLRLMTYGLFSLCGRSERLDELFGLSLYPPPPPPPSPPVQRFLWMRSTIIVKEEKYFTTVTVAMCRHARTPADTDARDKRHSCAN